MAVKEEKKILGMDREKYRMFMGKYGIGTVSYTHLDVYKRQAQEGYQEFEEFFVS